MMFKVTTTILVTMVWLWGIFNSAIIMSGPSDLMLAIGVMLGCGFSGVYVWLLKAVWSEA